jgi:hypothetical protein
MVDINQIKIGDIVTIDFDEVLTDFKINDIAFKNLKLFDKKYKETHKVTKVIKNEIYSKNQKIELEEDYWFFPKELNIYKEEKINEKNSS